MRLTPSSSVNQPANANGSEELRTIAASLRQSAHHVVGDAYAQCKRLELQKSETGVTAGIVFHALPGRVRLRHPLLEKNPDLCVRVQGALGVMAGVDSVTTTTRTGSVLVLFQPNTTTPEKLLTKVERVVSGLDDCESLLAGPPASYWIAAGTCLTLAVTSAYFIPGLGPATAIALVGFNLPTLGRGLKELVTLNWGVSALYTVIMGTTLASGAYLAAALMQASVTAWHSWSSYRLRQVVRDLMLEQETPDQLLDDANSLGQPRYAPGVLVNVQLGVTLPFDGIVISGEGEFEEHRVRGVTGTALRRVGDQVFAGSVLVTGQVQVEVVAVGANTRLATIRRTVRSVIGKTAGKGGPTKRGKALASRFVPYTFVTGTAAFLVGGLPTLAAVLRPDFATGPSLSERFGTLSGVGHLLHEGWLVNSPDALYDLSRIKTVVIAHREHDDSETTELRVTRTPLRVGSRVVDVHEITGSEDDCLEYIDELTATGRRVAVAACHHILGQFLEDEVIRISLTPEAGVGPQHADLIALHSEPQRLESLLHILHETDAPGRNAWAVVLGCNALAISGAFLVGLTSLHVVVLTNIGALAAGAMYSRHMRRADRLLAARRECGQSTGHEILLPAACEDEAEEVTPAITAPSECNVIETTAVEVVTSTEMSAETTTPTETEPRTPGLRRAHRRDARRKQAAAQANVLPNTDTNETTLP